MSSRLIKAYAYARVSSEAQAEKGTSIPSQLENIRNYALDNDIRIIHEFVDVAETATTDLRPQFQEMISLCRNDVQGISAILVWKLSRFARNRIDSVVYKKLLSKQGIRVISISEPIDDTPEGRILEGMIELIDSYYCEILSKESMRGLKQNAQQGFHCGGRPPYGYKTKIIETGGTTKKIWEIEPKEAEAVRAVYKMHSEGHTYKEIIDYLEKEGYKPRLTKTWGKSSISEILRKPCYSGIHYFNTRKRKELGKRVHSREAKDKSEWIAIEVPPIVDKKTFNAVKKKMKNRQLRAPRKNTDRILSGLLICGKCGQPYTIASYYQKKYPYYRCTTRKSQGKVTCDNRGLRGDKLDKFIISVVMKQIFAPENFENYKQVIDDSVRQERQELLQEAENLTKKLDEIRSKKQVYYDGLETGQLEMNIVSERLKALHGKEEKLLAKQAEVGETLLGLPDSEDYVLSKKEYAKLKSTLGFLLDKSEPSRIRSFLQTFIKCITVNPDNIEIAYSLPAIHQKKGPAPFISEGQSLSVLELASPTGFEPVSPA